MGCAAEWCQRALRGLQSGAVSSSRLQEPQRLGKSQIYTRSPHLPTIPRKDPGAEQANPSAEEGKLWWHPEHTGAISGQRCRAAPEILWSLPFNETPSQGRHGSRDLPILHSATANTAAGSGRGFRENYSWQGRASWKSSAPLTKLK